MLCMQKQSCTILILSTKPIFSGNARHKLGRLHYVRSTAEEAAHTCRRSHSAHRWRANQIGRATWFSEHVPEGYATFEQFRNGHDFCIH